MVEGEHTRREMICVGVIPHSKQRYETSGDFVVEDGLIDVAVSNMGNSDFEFLVAIHEIVEAYLCHRRGITDDEITTFDVEFEAKRKPGDLSEPGDSRDAPYAVEHCLATSVERMICGALGLSWQDYEQAVQRLSQ